MTFLENDAREKVLRPIRNRLKPLVWQGDSFALLFRVARLVRAARKFRIWNIYFCRPWTASNLYACAPKSAFELEADMLDAIFLCGGLAFFAAAVGYTLICERL